MREPFKADSFKQDVDASGVDPERSTARRAVMLAPPEKSFTSGGDACPSIAATRVSSREDNVHVSAGRLP